MTKVFTAVVEHGALKPTEHVDLPEGETVRVTVSVPGMSTSEFEAALDALQAEARKYADEWWEDFDRELRENRVNFKERV
jgi:predicted DNA-binding antitoxin AbrB/MazE fold protein